MTPSTNVTEEDLRKLKTVWRTIEAFRSIDPKMPSSYMAAFISVAMEPGLGPTEYARRLGTHQAIASRVLLEIGPKSRLKDSGYGLVQVGISNADMRAHSYELTTKGRVLLQRLLDLQGNV